MNIQAHHTPAQPPESELLLSPPHPALHSTSRLTPAVFAIPTPPESETMVDVELGLRAEVFQFID